MIGTGPPIEVTNPRRASLIGRTAHLLLRTPMNGWHVAKIFAILCILGNVKWRFANPRGPWLVVYPEHLFLWNTWDSELYPYRGKVVS